MKHYLGYFSSHACSPCRPPLHISPRPLYTSRLAPLTAFCVPVCADVCVRWVVNHTWILLQQNPPIPEVPAVICSRLREWSCSQKNVECVRNTPYRRPVISKSHRSECALICDASLFNSNSARGEGTRHGSASGPPPVLRKKDLRTEAFQKWPQNGVSIPRLLPCFRVRSVFGVGVCL